MLARTAADGSWRSQLGGASKRLGVFAAAGAAVFLVLLDVMDRIAPPYNPNTHKLVSGGPLGHVGHMLSYQANLTSPHGPTGIASYPWEWLVDYKPITYLYINPARPTRGLYNIHPAVHFLGMVSPPIMLLALPGLAVAAWRLLRGGRPARIDEVPSRPDPNAAPAELAILALAWFAGTFLPFELLSVIDSRTSYLYYMVIVMPGIYAAIVHLFARWRPQRWVLVSWGALVLVAAILMYPFTPLP
jgi:hypothetical protein